MADFEPLFELKNQYRESCPVLLQSGALYREEPTASAEAEETETAEATLPAEQEEAASPRTFLRLAFRNIDPRAVTSVYVDIHIFDKATNELAVVRDRRYLVPILGRDAVFGADEEIVVSCLGVDERIDNLAYEKIAGRCASFQPEKHDRLILQRIAQARIDDPAENAVFHGTYFRTAKNDDVRSVLTVHDFTHQKYFKGRQRTVNTVLKAKCIASCDSIICISENTKKDLFRYFPSAKEKDVSVVYNGVSDDFRTLSSIPETKELKAIGERKFLLYVGSRVGYKNFDFAVSLLEDLEDCVLVAVGGGPIARSELPGSGFDLDRILHFENVGNTELNALYNRAYALIYPSKYEGFGIPVLEAMRAGCPAIAFSVSSIPEVAGDSPLLIDEGDRKQCLSVLEALGKDGFRKEALSYQLARSSGFSWDRCYGETKSVYRHALATH